MNKRIKELRKYLQYNQKQFADALGIAQTSVSFLEREGSNVTELVQDGDQLKKDLILTILKLDSEDWKVIKKIITGLNSNKKR